MVIKLPADSHGKPDWKWMENYVKLLPYGGRLASNKLGIKLNISGKILDNNTEHVVFKALRG